MDKSPRLYNVKACPSQIPVAQDVLINDLKDEF